MHDTSMLVGGKVLQSYCFLPSARILDVGAYNVNGSLRDLVVPGTVYVGLDFEAGPGVDIVVQPGETWPVQNDYFDIVMASSVLEHDPIFWQTFLILCAKAKAGGYIYLNVPANGPFHRYPVDNWRFYPDAGDGLVQWARSQGVDVCLVESFTTQRIADTWNDFVAVFRKGPAGTPLPVSFVADQVDCRNIRKWNAEGFSHLSEIPQDIELLDQARAQASEAQVRLAALEEQLAQLGRARDHLAAQLQAAENAQHEMAAHHAEAIAAAQTADDTAGIIARHEAQLVDLQHRFDATRSELRQREEEISQAGADVADLRQQLADQTAIADRAQSENSNLAQRLADADKWVFSLANERRLAENAAAAGRKQMLNEARRADRAQALLDSAQTRFDSAEARSHIAQTQVDSLRVDLAEAQQQLGTLDATCADLRTETQVLNDRLEQMSSQKVRIDKELALRFKEMNLLADMLRKREQEVHAAGHTVRGGEIENSAQLADLTRQLEQANRAEIAARELLEQSRQMASRHAQQADRASQEGAVELDRALATIRSLNDHLAQSDRELGAARAASATNTDRIAGLTQLLGIQERLVEQREADAQWLRTAHRVMTQVPWWWLFMPLGWRDRKVAARMKRRGLFDSEAYSARYPDVAEQGIKPLTHYIHHGIGESRKPN